MSFLDWAIPLAATGASLFFGNQAANRVADSTAQSSEAAIRAQRDMFDISREDLLPYRETGAQAMFGLADLYGVPRPDGAGGFTRGRSFQESPGYQFRFGEGARAIDRSASSRGNLLSGGTMKALTQYGQNMAADEWGSYTNALRSLAGLGQTATGAGVTSASNTGGAIGNALMFGGQGSANAGIMQANSMNNALNNLSYVYGRNR